MLAIADPSGRQLHISCGAVLHAATLLLRAEVGPVRLRLLPTEQRFDFPGLRSRVLSASYMPAEGHPSHGPMLQRLWLLFDEHQQGGEVVFEYDLEVYFGRLA